MKASDKPEISKKWWTSEKPGEIKGSDLEKALGNVEKALADSEKKSEPRTLEASLAALQELKSAVDKTIKKELDKKKHKDEITVLEKFYPLITSQTSRLAAQQQKAAQGGAAQSAEEDGEDEEVSDNQLFEKDYLHKMMKLMKSSGKELKFGFGLNTKEPEASTLLLKRKGKPEMLFKLLKKDGDFTNRLITYGYALPDSEDSKTLVFRLEQGAGEPPQIIKLGRKFLRSDKNLRFRKLKVILPNGQTIVDTEPDTEDEEMAGGPAAPAGGAGDLQARLRSAAAAAQKWKQTRESVADQIAKLRRELDAFDDPDVRSVRDRLGSVLERYPNLDFTGLAGAADQAAYDRSLTQTRQGIAGWARLLTGDTALHAIDENPFVSTNVVDTLGESLKSIAGELKL